MILFIPYHEALSVSYNELAQSIMRAGTNPNHTLAIISLRSQDHGAFMFGNALTDYFGRHVKISIDDRVEHPIDSSNRFFTAALNGFRKYKPSSAEAKNAPMMYFDPSYVPNNPRWLDDLQADYFKQGAPQVFGSFGDSHIPTGPLILSRQYADTSTLLSFMPQGNHWRNYLAWEFFKNKVEAVGIGTHDSAVVIPQSACKRPTETLPKPEPSKPAIIKTKPELADIPDPMSLQAILRSTPKKTSR